MTKKEEKIQKAKKKLGIKSEMSPEEFKKREAVFEDSVECCAVRATLKDSSKLVVLDTNIPFFQSGTMMYQDIHFVHIKSQDKWCINPEHSYLIDTFIQMMGFSAYIFEKGVHFLIEKMIEEQEYLDRKNGVVTKDDDDEDDDWDMTEEDLFEINLQRVDCTINRDKKNLFTMYLYLILPHWQKVAKTNPRFPDYIAEDESLLYSLLLAAEQIELLYSENMELWSVLKEEQQTLLHSYATRFMDYLKREKNADAERIEELLKQDGLTIFDLMPELPRPRIIEDHSDEPCEFITPTDIKSAEDIDKEIRDAAKQPASVLAAYIKRALKLGYLDFGKLSMPKVFEKIKAHYQISYSYDNFRKAYANV